MDPEIVDEPKPGPPQDNTGLYAILALGFLAGGAILWYFAKPSSGGPLNPSVGGMMSMTKPKDFAAPTALEPDRLYRTQPALAAEGGELSFADLLNGLKGGPRTKVTAEVAKKIEEAFNADPKLKAAYDDFKGRSDAGQRPTASEFMGTLRALPAFAKLANQFMGAPGSGSLLMAIGRQPEMQHFLQTDTARIAAAARARAGRTTSHRLPLAGEGRWS